MNVNNWGWPQWVDIFVTITVLFADYHRDGQPKEGNHSFIMSLVSSFIGLFILYMGGFFR